MKKIFSLLAVAMLGGILTLGGYKLFLTDAVIIEEQLPLRIDNINTNFNSAFNTTPTNNETYYASIDFTEAAEKSLNAVVHVKNTAIRTQVNPMDFFFGNGNGRRQYEAVGTGSGVIISSDGYIVTNNHVIANANDIEITLNNRQKFKARLIGTDKDNDIALLKIDTDEKLPYLPFANSDSVKIGEWVLAVGNPYNLTSTVTAGIVSAKGRDLEGNSSIDSFIQTDAAVNPGNSGGALVNTRGELVGINTAITSKTGSFIGYSFAVPSNIAKKIVDDLLEFGTVQEAVLGISIDNSENNIDGVKIAQVFYDGGARKAGLKDGDIIKKVNNVKISKFSELRGQLTAKRPGEYVNITVEREGKFLTKSVMLNKRDTYTSRALGISLKDLSKEEKRKLNIKGGAKIQTNNNKSLEYYGVKEGYIITKINRQSISNASDAVRVLENSVRSKNPFYIEVINLEGVTERYGFR